MPILFSVVLKGSTLLAKYANCAGNFMEVTEQVMTKIPPHDDKMTYTHSNYLFHYITENGITYMCITDDEFERSRSFLFLNEVKRRFSASYGSSIEFALPYSMNAEFSPVLANEMRHYSESNDVDTIAKVHGELDELMSIMIKNIDEVQTRGEGIKLLVNKTEGLSNNAVSYRIASRNLQRSMFWKNVRIYVIIFVVCFFIIYFGVSMACGGLLWQKCVGSQ